jgi:AraC-like DNA-binding protein
VSQRLDAYVGVLCEQLLHITTSSPEREHFRSEMVTAALGQVKVSSIGGSIQDSVRTTTNIVRSREQAYHLVMAVGCRWKFVRKEGELCLRPGDLVLTDTRFEHSAHWPDNCLALNLRMPMDWLQEWIPEPRRLVGQLISKDSPWGSVLSNYVARLTPESIPGLPLPGQVLADQVGALLTLAAMEVPGGLPRQMQKRGDVRDRIVECIRGRCSESELSASGVASSLAISTRTLHRALAACGETFGRKLIEARVEVGARMLESRLYDRLTIAEIGRRAGFIDPSHFARMCRAHLGHTPAVLRRTRTSS